MSALEVTDLTFSYGQVGVLHGVSFEVGRGEIVALIGPNGAGKTTLLNVISGALSPDSGNIRHEGDPIGALSQRRLVRRGVVLVPEGREVFSSLTVEDNLRLGAYARRRNIDVQTAMRRVFDLFPRLPDRRLQLAGTMSGGEQQMLAIGRGLMSEPDLLLLDEPSLGLAPQLVGLIMDTLIELRRDGVTILLVEQNARAALELADHAYLLETGAIKIGGPAKELATDPQVMATYLGGSAASGASDPAYADGSDRETPPSEPPTDQ